ncbi:MAG: HD domain-containing protein [Firmicutes bacterium]|nr:HD domain-containing protein [Bacillota bacterium]
MRRVRVAALRPGMRLGMPVYGSRGLLLREGVELGPAHIQRLERARLEAVYIDDPLFADILMPADVSWEVKFSLLSACSALWEYFRTLAPRDAPGGTGGGAGDGGAAVRWPVPYERLMETASALEVELRQVPAWAVQMLGGGDEDGVVAHAVNTALMAASLARQAGLGGYVRELAVAGLLHDMGLALLPARLHSEPDAVEEGDRPLLHAHPLLGVRLMRSQPVSAYVQAAVAQHHERFDGSGYPQRLGGSRLAPHAQLVAVADTFARMVQAGVSRNEAWEYVVSGAGSEFDHRLVQAFSQVIPPYPLGSTVRLSTGEEGVVVGLQTGLLTRPRVRLLRDAAGRPVSEPVTYDLAEGAHRNRVIVGEALEA